MMKLAFVLLAVAALIGVAGCGEVQKATGTGCYAYTDEVACVADLACHWNKAENRCKK